MQWRDCGRAGAAAAIHIGPDAPAAAAAVEVPRGVPQLIFYGDQQLDHHLHLLHQRHQHDNDDERNERERQDGRARQPAAAVAAIHRAGIAAGRRGAVGGMGPAGQRLGQPIQEANSVREGKFKSRLNCFHLDKLRQFCCRRCE